MYICVFSYYVNIYIYVCFLDPLEHALEGVAAMRSNGYAYYIGICQDDAVARWSQGSNRHCTRFNGMVVIADNATASLEQRVIAACQTEGEVLCLNTSKGKGPTAEGPTAVCQGFVFTRICLAFSNGGFVTNPDMRLKAGATVWCSGACSANVGSNQ